MSPRFPRTPRGGQARNGRVLLHGLTWPLALLICGHLHAANAISLTDPQREKLARLVRSNPEAARLFQKLKQQADAALDDRAQPLVRIQTAGKLQSDSSKVASRAGLEDMKKLHALGYTFAVTTNVVYGAAARKAILCWAQTNQPTGVPIDETKLEPLFIAYDLTRSTFAAEDRQIVERWLRIIAERELNQVRPQSATANNNWNSHRLKIVGLIGFLLQDRALMDRAVEGFRLQIQRNLRPDGSSFDFHERDALHYHCYDLEPLLTLAIVAAQNHVNLYDYASPGGASLSNSVRFLVPYCNGTKTHAEWVNSKVEFDHSRAQAGEEKFRVGSPFEPRSALRVFELAAFFDDQLEPMVSQLANKPGVKYATWQCVINDAVRP